MKTVSIILLLCVWSLGVAADKPNFGGTWVLDKNKSFSNPPGFNQTMTITHSGDQIKIEGKQTTARGEFHISRANGCWLRMAAR